MVAPVSTNLTTDLPYASKAINIRSNDRDDRTQKAARPFLQDSPPQVGSIYCPLPIKARNILEGVELPVDLQEEGSKLIATSPTIDFDSDALDSDTSKKPTQSFSKLADKIMSKENRVFGVDEDDQEEGSKPIATSPTIDFDSDALDSDTSNLSNGFIGLRLSKIK
jgi:hypothetical protein